MYEHGFFYWILAFGLYLKSDDGDWNYNDADKENGK